VILYIAGPMSHYPEFNYPAFCQARAELQELGYQTLCPTDNTADSWDNYMRASIAQVIAAEGIAVLPGWELSAGACLEVKIAQTLRMPVLTLDSWLRKAIR
jgi:hypothetical protein